jgi:hypothetical protein
MFLLGFGVLTCCFIEFTSRPPLSVYDTEQQIEKKKGSTFEGKKTGFWTKFHMYIGV